MSFKLLYLNELTGEYGKLPDFGIINAGGIGGSTFTVGNKALIFADGTATDGVSSTVLSTVSSNLSIHLAAGGIKHASSQISIDTSSLANVTGTNIQQAIGSIDALLNTIVGYEHVQTAPVTTWTVAHGKNSKKAHITVWDMDDEQVLPDRIRIIDLQSIEISFNTPQAGRAVLVLV